MTESWLQIMRKFKMDRIKKKQSYIPSDQRGSQNLENTKLSFSIERQRAKLLRIAFFPLLIFKMIVLGLHEANLANTKQ